MGAHFQLKLDTLPRTLLWDKPVSETELEILCAANDVLQLERIKDGEIRLNPPTELLTSDGKSELNLQLRNWWKGHRRGKVAESNGGFYLDDGSMLSPDAAYISPDRVKTIPRGQLGFPHACPNFVIELLSRSDTLRQTKDKMADWIANGLELGWLIDPYKQQVLVYEPGTDLMVVTAETIVGAGPVEGLILNLTEVWRCFE